jgi:dTDP-4-amino-4,6-dideoxygalactose transaminase
MRVSGLEVSDTDSGEPIRLARPDVGDEELAALAEVVRSGRLTMGPKVEELEAAIAHAVGTAHAAAVSSGTAALHLALLALGVGPGDEVIVPAYTFPATANAVELCGARAVLVDVDPDTFVVDPAAVAAAVTSRTRVVLAVHLFGRPVDWEALQTAVPQEVALLEDAAGALGARYRGTPCGALGVAACLSFHPRKIVTTGEGGAVTTDEAELDSAVRRLRHHGWATLGDMPAPGFNYRLPDLLCAIGIPQLRRLEELLAARERVAAWYAERLEHFVLTPRAAGGDRHGWQAYVVQLDRRDEALAALRDAGIEAQIGTWALHRLAAYRDQGPFPGADRAFENALALPFAATTTEQEVDRVAAALTAVVSK